MRQRTKEKKNAIKKFQLYLRIRNVKPCHCVLFIVFLNSNVIFECFKVSQVWAKCGKIVTLINNLISNFSFRFYVKYSFETLEILSFFFYFPFFPP